MTLVSPTKIQLFSRPIRGLLLDVTGVLYNSGVGDGEPINGSIDAIRRLTASNIPFRLLSNESSSTPEHFADKLRRLGFDLNAANIITPAPFAVRYLQHRRLRPHLLVHPNVRSVFADVDQSNPNCVVMGDADYEFTPDNMQTAFRLLLSLDDPILITLGYGKFYMNVDGPKLDVGAYAKALEYACNIEATVIGKPQTEYFNAAINDMGLDRDDVVMVGDDIVSDVGAAQRIGMRAVQVRTGKWRREWEQHETVTPNAICDNLAEFIDQLLNL